MPAVLPVTNFVPLEIWPGCVIFIWRWTSRSVHRLDAGLGEGGRWKGIVVLIANLADSGSINITRSNHYELDKTGRISSLLCV